MGVKKPAAQISLKLEKGVLSFVCNGDLDDFSALTNSFSKALLLEGEDGGKATMLFRHLSAIVGVSKELRGDPTMELKKLRADVDELKNLSDKRQKGRPLNLHEAAAFLHEKNSTVNYLIEYKNLPYYKPHSVELFFEDELIEWITRER